SAGSGRWLAAFRRKRNREIGAGNQQQITSIADRTAQIYLSCPGSRNDVAGSNNRQICQSKTLASENQIAGNCDITGSVVKGGIARDAHLAQDEIRRCRCNVHVRSRYIKLADYIVDIYFDSTRGRVEI